MCSLHLLQNHKPICLIKINKALISKFSAQPCLFCTQRFPFLITFTAYSYQKMNLLHNNKISGQYYAFSYFSLRKGFLVAFLLMSVSVPYFIVFCSLLHIIHNTGIFCCCCLRGHNWVLFFL